MSAGIEVILDDLRWASCPGVERRLRRAARLALRSAGCTQGQISATILLASDARLRALNSRYRRKPKTTNVLSFAARASKDGYLGDVALAYGVCMRESRASLIPLVDHATHLAVHGILHLLGHDHKTARKAQRMEALEIAVLAELGVRDPYAERAKPA